MAGQKAALEPRRDAACAELKAARKEEYRGILDDQRAVRAEFGERIETGLDNAGFFHDLTERRNSRTEALDGFRAATIEVTRNFQGEQPRAPLHAEVEESDGRLPSSHRERDVADFGKHLAVASVGGFLDSLFTDLTNLGAARPEPVSREARADAFREAAENTLKQRQHHEKEEDDSRWRERQRVNGE